MKKLLSSLGVAIAGAVLVTLNAYVVKLPEVYQGLAGAGLAAFVHYVNAWGTHAQVEQKIFTEGSK